MEKNFKGKTIVVYYDFENVLSYNQLLKRIISRSKGLIKSGFTDEQVMVIIFDDPSLRESLLNEEYIHQLKDDYKKSPDLPSGSGGV